MGMEIRPIASESLGVRSFCVQVITEHATILIDPSVSLAPRRYGLPPHALEIKRMNEVWDEILRRSEESDVIVITHYHFDHFSLDEPEQFKDKWLLIKHPREKINFSQMRRSSLFLEKVEGIARKIEYCDGREFKIGGTTLRFSPPVCHGIDKRLGFVVEVSITEGEEKLLFTSDVEGPALEEQVEFIIRENPRILFVDGPMTYMLGYRYPHDALAQSLRNLIEIIKSCEVLKLVLDHHLLRDLDYAERIKEVREEGMKKGCEVVTMAELLGKENELLEARRKELFQLYRHMEEKPKKSITSE